MTAAIVIKVGGSLLVRPHVGHTLRHWLMLHGAQRQVNLIIGGGAMIDGLRVLARIHRPDEVAMHWRCVRALRHTMELVAEWIPEAVVIDTPEAFSLHRRQRRPGWYLIAPDTFYHPLSGDDLPCDWTTTSDSIAALLARKLAAERLVLLKSCAIADQLDVVAAAAGGIVDPVFPKLIDQTVAVELLSF